MTDIPTFLDPRFADPTYGVTVEHATVAVSADVARPSDNDRMGTAIALVQLKGLIAFQFASPSLLRDGAARPDPQ